ncbi:MAG: alpha/beta hydrolase [Lachnospiraceae bacterium]|nr:alpha/beta hydrolase [Lachnospiraceae bacterium]
MIINNKNIYLYGEKESPVPLVIVNTFQGEGNEVYSALKDLTDKKFCLAVISDINWDDEMSPWECPALYKNDAPCTGGADEYLDKLTSSIIPGIKEELASDPERIIIAGYSLGGLFALYSLYKTGIFSAAVSASGSMWFPGFLDFTDKNDFYKRPEKIYFSLGDKEAKTRNPLLSTVEKNTREIYENFKGMGIETVFEMNPGNHFKDADIRLAKGIAWILE